MEKEIEITVPFYDLDPMQVVWHGNYVKYMERARCALLADCAMTYTDMERIGFAFPIVTINVKYIKPSVFGQKIIVRVKHVPNENFLMFKYQMFDAETHDKICVAETKQMAVNLKTHESYFQLPEPFLTIFEGEK